MAYAKNGDSGAPPDELSYLWDWYIDLHRRRGHDGFSGRRVAITYREIAAWSKLTGAEVEPWEVRVICWVDDMVLASGRKDVEGTSQIRDPERIKQMLFGPAVNSLINKREID